jgi:hypothetical protein
VTRSDRRQRVRELEALLTLTLARHGFKKSPGLYFAPLVPGVRAWLALPVIRDGDCLDVHPNVGVRHDELHALIDRLKGRKTGTEPTLARMLGYLMPQNTANVTWEFALSDDATWHAQAENLAEHIDLYGRPWMSQYLTLESVVEDLAPYNTDRRAAGLMMLGRVEQARADVDAELAALGGRHDAASDAYRELAQALVAEFAPR